MAINRAGFNQTNSGLEISKDPQAELSYTFDWSEWLEPNDTIVSVLYTAAARRNDPTPLEIVSSGFTQDTTFVELGGGQEDKVYVVTARIQTANGLIDRRAFRVIVENRQA